MVIFEYGFCKTLFLYESQACTSRINLFIDLFISIVANSMYEMFTGTSEDITSRSRTFETDVQLSIAELSSLRDLKITVSDY